MRTILTSSRRVAVTVIFLILCGMLATHSASAQRQRVSILGDSYSTFIGYIPAGNAIWYTGTTERTDVTSVRQTWWWEVISEGGYLLEKNDSFSGATVSYTGYNRADYSDRSFITRLPRVGSPDILLIFGCINDSWAGVPVGEFKYEDITRLDLYTYRPALARLLEEAQSRYPNVEIYYIIGEGLREDITDSTKEICDHFGIPYIHLHDIATQEGHPTIAGMDAIARQVLAVLQPESDEFVDGAGLAAR